MFTLSQPHADIFVPDGAPPEVAFSRTTLLGVGAHQDDLEFMAFHPILKAFDSEKDWFMGVTVTNGSGSARSGEYERYTDAEMMEVRREEQREAAVIGTYSAMLQLDHSSSAVKDPHNTMVVDDLEKILRIAQPREVYTHNPADKHDTHAGVLLKLIDAIRRLPTDMRPTRLIGCEAWRDLDWLCDEDKVVMDVSGGDDLANDLLNVFDSQIEGGKRYDLAVRGRRRANATFLESHETDRYGSVIFGMDMTACIDTRGMNPYMLFNHYWEKVREEVRARHAKLRRK